MTYRPARPRLVASPATRTPPVNEISQARVETQALHERSGPYYSPTPRRLSQLTAWNGPSAGELPVAVARFLVWIPARVAQGWQ